MKIFGIVLGSTLLLSVVFAIQVRSTQLRMLEQESQKQGLSIARDVAAQSIDLILVNDLYSLYQLLAETQINYQDVRYVFILNNQGEILAHTFGSGFPLDLVAVNSVSNQDLHSTVVLRTDEGTVWDVAVPIFDGKAGVARVGISDQSVQAIMLRLTSQLLLTLLGVLMLSLLAASFLTSILTRPILELVEATRAVGKGDFSPRVRRWADDEIGDLAAAFNQMTTDLGRLEEVRAERENLRQQLIEGMISAQEEERKRVARELHDSTSQSLTSLKMGLRSLETLCNEPGLHKQMDDLCQVLDHTLGEVHNLAVELRPMALDDLGLEAGLQHYVEDWRARYNVPLDAVIRLGRGRLPETVETALYRIVQEGLTNIARHAHAHNASLLIDRRDDEILAVIEDDGIGFDRRQPHIGPHLGLVGVHERAELLGGTLTVETAPERGTSLFIRIPLTLDEGEPA